VTEGGLRLVTGARIARLTAPLFGLVALALIALPLFVDRGVLQSLFEVLTLLTLAQYWNLMAGYAGLVSIGQQAFVGVGGYTMFALAADFRVDPLLAIPLAGVAAALVAAAVSRLVFRLDGAYFAVGTWVIAEALRLVAAVVPSLGGGTGASLTRDVVNGSVAVSVVASALDLRAAAGRDVATYWVALALALTSIALVYGILRSRSGLALTALGDDEAAARSLGVSPARLKLLVYLIAAQGAGMTGALVYWQKARISPDAAFSLLDWTANVLFTVIIGGVATIEGPIVGVAVFYGLQQAFSAYGPLYLAALGAMAITVVTFFRRGLWGAFAERFGASLFPIRRQLMSDSAIAPATRRKYD
jgi:branched-chain amino acid transport system permease protein